MRGGLFGHGAGSPALLTDDRQCVSFWEATEAITWLSAALCAGLHLCLFSFRSRLSHVPCFPKLCVPGKPPLINSPLVRCSSSHLLPAGTLTEIPSWSLLLPKHLGEMEQPEIS